MTLHSSLRLLLLLALWTSLTRAITKEEALKAAKAELEAIKANADELSWVQKQPLLYLQSLSWPDWEAKAPEMTKTHRAIAKELSIDPSTLIANIWAYAGDPEVASLIRERVEITGRITKQGVLKVAKAELAALQADPVGLAWIKSQHPAVLGAMKFEDYLEKVPNLAKVVQKLAEELDFTPEEFTIRKSHWYMVWQADPDLAPVLGQLWETYKPLSKETTVEVLKGELEVWKNHPEERDWYKKLNWKERRELPPAVSQANIPSIVNYFAESQKKHGVPFESIVMCSIIHIGDPGVRQMMKERAKIVGVPEDSPPEEKQFLKDEL